MAHTIYSQGGKQAYDCPTYVVDTVEDLKKLRRTMGTTALVLETTDVYIINSEGIWINMTSVDGGSVSCDCVSELTIWDDIPVSE